VNTHKTRPDSERKRNKWKLLPAALILLLFTGSAAGFAGGSGTSGDPYEISTCQQLQNMSKDLDAYYELVSDVDCSGFDYSSVGDDSNRFTSVLDGQNHTVNNLTINEGYSDYVGLIGYLGSGGEVKDVGVVNADITGSYYVGGLVAYNSGSVSGSYSTGSISGSYYPVGGLVGYNSGSVSGSYSTGSNSGDREVGGLVGYNIGSVSSSFSTGSVSGVYSVGGLVGSNSGSVSNSYWDTESSGQSSSDGGTGLTTSEMIGDSASENMEGFNFSSNWETVSFTDPGQNFDGYPILQSLDREKQIEAQPSRLKNLHVQTSEVNSILTDSFAAEVALTALNDSEADISLQYRKTGQTSWSETSQTTVNSPQLLNITASGLESGTEYEFRPKASNSTDTVYGYKSFVNTTMLKTIESGSTTFTTEDYNVSTLGIKNDSNVGTSWLRFRGEASDMGNVQEPLNFNFSYRKEGASEWNNVKAANLTSDGTFEERVDGLENNTTYEYRATSEAGPNGSIKKVNTTLLKTIPSGSTTFTTKDFTLETLPVDERFDRLKLKANISGLENQLQEPENLTFHYRKTGATNFNEVNKNYTDNKVVQTLIKGLERDTVYEFKASSAGKETSLATASTSCTLNRTLKIGDGEVIGDQGCQKLTLEENGTLKNTNNTEAFKINVTNNVTLKNGSKIRANVNITSKNLKIEENAEIDASGLGYTEGPGDPISGGYKGPGGSYGGRGKSIYGGEASDTYGSVSDPGLFGSGGSDDNSDKGRNKGGGRIIIDVNNIVKANGILTAKGEKSDNYYGPGSGGSINIEASEFSGIGFVKAEGGGNTKERAGTAGGGRIAINSSKYKFEGEINVQSRDSIFARPAENGTVYPYSISCDEVEEGRNTCDDPFIPDLNLDYRDTLDVSEKALVNFSVREPELENVSITENSTGSFQKHYMENTSSGDWLYNLTSSNPAQVEFRLRANDSNGELLTLERIVSFENISVGLNHERKLNPAEEFTLSGDVKRLPYGSNVSGEIIRGNINESVPLTGFESFWTFSSSSGVLEDKISDNDGTVESITDRNAAGSIGGSFRFESGNNDYINIGDKEEFTHEYPLSIVAKVQPEGAGDILHKQDSGSSGLGYKLAYTGEKFNCRTGGGNWKNARSDTVTEGEWYNVRCEWSSSGGEIYVDGIREGSSGVHNDPYTSGAPVQIGGRNCCGRSKNYFTGNIAYLGIANSVSVGSTVINGSYNLLTNALEKPGNYSLDVEVNDSYRVAGSNSSFIEVYNLTIEQVNDDGPVFKDGDSLSDLTFGDNLLSDSRNPGNLSDVLMEYEVPEAWNIRQYDADAGTLAPGDEHNNNPRYDIGPDAELGVHTVNVSADSAGGITDERQVNVEVWRRAQSEFLDAPDFIDQSSQSYTFTAEVVDDVNGSRIADHPVKFILNDGSNLSVTRYTNESGVANITVDVADLNLSESQRLGVRALDKPSTFTNSTDTPRQHYFDVVGVMNLDYYSPSESPPLVYRNDSVEGVSDGKERLDIVVGLNDSSGDAVGGADLNLTVNGQVEDQVVTDSSGEATLSFEPGGDYLPGDYQFNITAEKDNYAPFSFEDSVEIRDILNVTQNHGQNEFVAGEEHILSARTIDSLGNDVDGDLSWDVDDADIASGDAITWIPDHDLGFHNITVQSDRDFYDDDNDTKEVQVFGEANLTDLSPRSAAFRSDSEINLSVKAVDDLTSENIQGLNVTFTANSTEIGTAQTNSSGIAEIGWTPASEGNYTVNASIDRQEGLNYIPKVGEVSKEYEAVKEMKLESLTVSEREIFRDNLFVPSETKFTVELSETASKPENVPAENVQVTFDVKDEEQVSCTTDSQGTCSSVYNPSSNMSLGPATVEITTDRPDWKDISKNTEISVVSTLSAFIIEPEDNELVRNNTEQLQANLDPQDSEINVNWSLSGDQIARGSDTPYNVPTDLETGNKTLEITAYGNGYETTTDELEVRVLGAASVGLESGLQEINYDNSPAEFTCQVSDQKDDPVKNYLVNLTVDGTKIDSGTTDSNGEASLEWSIPESIGERSIGCQIEDEKESLSFIAEKSSDSKNLEVVDGVPPLIENISIPETSHTRAEVDIGFDASDEISLENVNVTVTDPSLDEIPLDVQNDSGASFSTTLPSDDTDLEGTYSVNISAFDSSGNKKTVLRTFDVEISGLLELDNSSFAADNITLQQGDSFTTDATFEALENVSNISVYAEGISAGITGSLSNNDCSDSLDVNQTCEVNDLTYDVEKGLGPGNYYGRAIAEWNTTDDQGDVLSQSTSELVEITVEQNPVMNVSRDLSPDIGIEHGGLYEENLTVESIGNYRLEDVKVESEGDMNLSEWLTLDNTEATSIEPGKNLSTEIKSDIPIGAYPGTYSEEISVTRSEGETVSRGLNIDIPVDVSFEAVPQTQTQGAVVNFTDEVAEFKFENNGNVEITIDKVKDTSKNGSDSVKMADSFDIGSLETENQSVEANFSQKGYFEAGFDFSSEPADPEIRNNREWSEDTSDNHILGLDVVEFENDIQTPGNTLVKLPGENTSITTKVTLDESPVTENITIQGFLNMANGEGGEYKAETSFSHTGSGLYTAEIEIPEEIPDARTYDLEVEVFDENRGVTSGDALTDRIKVPDITRPEITKINASNAILGENLSVRVNASDNNLEGVEEVYATANGPNISETENLTERENFWNTSFNISTPGDYIINVTAVDPAGNKFSDTGKARVGDLSRFAGNFTESGRDQGVEASINITDSFTGEKVASFNTQSENPKYNDSLLEGEYNIEIAFKDPETLNYYKVELEKARFTGNSSNPVRMSRVNSNLPLSPPASAKGNILAADVNMNVENATVTMPHGVTASNDPRNYKIARCKDLDYDGTECLGNYTTFNIEDENILGDRIEFNVSGFSSYAVFDPLEEQQDNQDEQQNEPDNGGGGGGGGGGLGNIEDTLDEINESLNEEERENVEFSANSIDADVSPGGSQRVSIGVDNSHNGSQTFEFEAGSTVEPYIDYPSSLTVDEDTSRELIVNVSAPPGEDYGTYSGILNAESELVDADIPVNVRVLPPDDELLDMEVDPVFSVVEPGDELRVETFLSNEGFSRNVDVNVTIELIDPDDNEVITRKRNTLAIGTTLTEVVELDVPEDTERKQYEIRGIAEYTNIDADLTASGVSTVTIDTPFWERTIMGITYMTAAQSGAVMILLLAAGLITYNYRKQKIMQKKRYMEEIDLETIPTSGGKGQGFIGEIAEMGKRTFVELDDLTTHALIAGATGSGKTVTGQVMVEEALQQGKNVIVLDPTAQWTGFLRENNDSQMLQLFKDFGMTMDDAQSFNGNIRAVEPSGDEDKVSIKGQVVEPEEEIDITPYLESDEEGNIIIFSMHKLENENMDEFVDSTIQQVFDQNLPERDHLETLIVYDEVHRLLEKFGGSGKGLKQLERGAREFRKWGVGMILLSQVISDFSGEIRANIGTTVQMRTQYDDDLQRMKNKFGMDTVKSIAKAEVGSGMLNNSEYNHGRPYFVNFRPLLHSPHRLSDEELEKYEKFNRKIDELENKVDKKEENGKNVYEERNLIKLARRNLKKGSFNLVETYLKDIKDKI
jgi:hypothetical protein